MAGHQLAHRTASRLGLFRAEWFRKVDGGGQVLVSEANEEGKADLRICLPASANGALVFKLTGNSAFPFLTDGQDCDGYAAIQGPDGSWHAVAVELKRRVKLTALTKGRAQLAAGLVRLQIVLDFLGISPSRWSAILAGTEDLVTITTNPDPARYHRTVGPGAKNHLNPLRDQVVVTACGINAAFHWAPVLVVEDGEVATGVLALGDAS